MKSCASCTRPGRVIHMSLYSWLVRDQPGLRGRCYKVPSLAGLPDPNKAGSEEAALDCQSANDEIEIFSMRKF